MFHLVKTAATAKDPFPGKPARCIKKTDGELQIVWGEVYAPGVPDSQGDFMTAETIRNMAYAFMRKQALDMIDTNHDREPNGSYVVESFIAREDDTVFIPGSWVVATRVSDAEWELVKSGELNGYSLDGRGIRVETEIELDMPDILKGETDNVEGHTHTFFVTYDDEGNFKGGYTSPGPDGHTHEILRGTVTEVAKGHAHRFSFVEGIVHAQSDL